MKIPIYFLGTSQAIPTAKRNHTAMLIKYKQEDILIDCGEGTQRQFRKAKINPCKLTRILISHWHGDHILGLPGLLQTLALNNYSKVLHIYGPKGTKKYLSLIFNLFVFVGKIKIKIHEIKSNKVLETEDFIIKAYSLNHGTPCLGYRFEEKDKIRLDKKKLKKYNLPQSPILQKLQQGKNIIYKGKTIKGKDVSYIEKGKKIGFILDTKITGNCYKIAKNTDLLVSESTYTENEDNLASEYKHLTAKQAAQIAKKSKAKKLILTHISQRYQKQESTVLKEAKSKFKPVILAEDLMKVEV
jgi:ribonuclease Z